MNELVTTNPSGKDITTSIIIAETFEKEHRTILRDIENLQCSDEFRVNNFVHTTYIHPQNKQTYPMYEITKDGFSFLAMGYTGAKAAQFKELFIKAFNKNEQLLKSDEYIMNRALFISAAKLKQLEADNERKDSQLRLQEHVITESAPKVEYYDDVLQASGLISTNIIAKDLGMSATTLNRVLHIRQIIYKSGETWVLYSKYQNLGYTKTQTHTYIDSHGNTQAHIHTYWTQKGRMFIHALVKSEREELQLT
jgi:Rha family phage regulatory protein